MIKIPKSLNEFKAMISEANLGDALTKVQTTMNNASNAVQAAVAPHLEGELGEVVAQLKKLQDQEVVLLKRLSDLVVIFQHDISVMKHAAAVEPAELNASVPATETEVVAEPVLSDKAAAS